MPLGEPPQKLFLLHPYLATNAEVHFCIYIQKKTKKLHVKSIWDLELPISAPIPLLIPMVTSHLLFGLHFPFPSMILVSIIIKEGVIILILLTLKTKWENGHNNSLKTQSTKFYHYLTHEGSLVPRCPANDFPGQMLISLLNWAVFIFIQKQEDTSLHHEPSCPKHKWDGSDVAKNRQGSLKTLTYPSRIV